MEKRLRQEESLINLDKDDDKEIIIWWELLLQYPKNLWIRWGNIYEPQGDRIKGGDLE